MGTVDTGTVVGGRYRIDDRIGRGGMADVYVAHDERLERLVAVKVLRPDMAMQADVRLRFESEARSAARLSHPNVVAVYDTGEHDGEPYIVMELIEGDTLADRLAQGPVDEPWLLGVAGGVLGALGAAHAAGIVHRDIKPANILIDAHGTARVADFGIAKVFEAGQKATNHTATNMVVGTPAYLPPERLSGEPSTPAGDLYALGVVMYEALAGQKPFDGNTPVAVASAIYQGRPTPLTEVRPDVTPGTAGAIEQAMDPDPAQRFGDTTAMAAALGVATIGAPLVDPTAVGGAATTVMAATGGTVEATTAAPAAAVGVAGAGAMAWAGGARRWWAANASSLMGGAGRWRLIAAAAGLFLVLLAAASIMGSDTGSAGDSEPVVATSSTTAVTAPPTTAASPAPAVTGKPDGRDGEDRDGEEDRDGKGKGRGRDD